MRKVVAILIIISAVIYGAQILIFHQVETTEFYLLQDLAFMPITIAIATIVVGQLMDKHEKEERLEKTKMLTSIFFTEIGAKLINILLPVTQIDGDVRAIIVRGLGEEDDADAIRQIITDAPIAVHINKNVFNAAKEHIFSHQTDLMIISSNPLLLEHECFTRMLWGVFHLIDEFRLRGDYDKLNEDDIDHYNDDFSKVLRLTLVNWVGNDQYLAATYPNFYATAKQKFREIRNHNEKSPKK